MKKLALLLVMIAFATTGCGEPAEGEDVTENDISIITETLNDGQVVECVVYQDGYAGGISCIPSLMETP